MKTLVAQLKKMIEDADVTGQFISEMSRPIIGHPASSMSGEQELFQTIVKRIEDEYMPLPKDADGMPIKLGDEVYIFVDARKFIVTGFDIKDNNIMVNLNFKEGGSKSELLKWPSEIVHGEPDTLERIEADARKGAEKYWDCTAFSCEDCPVRINGEIPCDHYDTGSCEEAMVLDVLARQRKVLERMAGHAIV